MEKPQLVFVHGGDALRDSEKLYALLRSRTFNPYETRQKWQEVLFEHLRTTYECHRLEMPNKYWADYEAWKIWFEKMVPFLREKVVLVGHSLGGGFLFRYLSENALPVTVSQIHLIAPVILPMADCDGFYIDTKNWTGFMSTVLRIHVWHSADDTIVPITHSEALITRDESIVFHHFTDRFHFIGDTFPELVTAIEMGK